MSDRWGPRLRIARRELGSLRAEKTIVLALLIQLFVAAFSSFLVVGLVSLYDPGTAGGGDLAVGVTGEGANDLAVSLQRQDDVAARVFETQADAEVAFQNGEVDAVLLTNVTNRSLVIEAVVPDGSIRTTVIVVRLQRAIETYERTERVERVEYLRERPLAVPDRVGSTPYFGFTYTILIPMLMFLPIFISGSIAVDSMTEEIQRGTLELLRVAPVSTWDIVDAKLVAAAGLAPAQAAAWLALLWLNGIPVVHGLPIVVVVTSLSVAVVSVGLGLAVLAPDRRQAQFLYSTGVLGVIAVTTLLPEHPANTIAKLAIGSPAPTTWPAVAGYAVIGVGTYVGIRALVARLDVEAL